MSFSEVSEIAMVPDSEWRMPTLMVSAAWMDQDRPMEAMDADSVKALSRLRRFIGVVLHSPAVGAAVFRRRRACRRASVRWTAGCALRPGSLRRGSRAKAVPLLGAGRYRSAKRRRESPGKHAEQAWLCRGRRRFQRVFAGYRRRRRRGHRKGMRRADLPPCRRRRVHGNAVAPSWHHRGASGRGIQGVRLRLVRSAWEQRTLQAGDDDLRRQCADEQAHQATDDL